MSVDDIVQLDLHYTFQGNPNSMCFQYKVTTSATLGNEHLAIISGWGASILGNLQPLHPVDLRYECYSVRDVFPGTDVPTVVVIDLPGTGLDTNQLPGQCQMLVQELSSTINTTPRTRGRDFFPALDDTDHVKGLWNQAIANNVLNWYVLHIGPGISALGGVYEFGVWSRTQRAENVDPQYVSNGGAVPDPPTFGNEPFTALDVFRAREKVRTQRRRDPRGPCDVFLVDETP